MQANTWVMPGLLQWVHYKPVCIWVLARCTCNTWSTEVCFIATACLRLCVAVTGEARSIIRQLLGVAASKGISGQRLMASAVDSMKAPSGEADAASEHDKQLVRHCAHCGASAAVLCCESSNTALLCMLIRVMVYPPAALQHSYCLHRTHPLS